MTKIGRKRKKVASLSAALLSSMLEDYGSAAEVARRLGLGRGSISDRCRRLGVPLPNPTGKCSRVLADVPTERLIHVYRLYNMSGRKAGTVFGVTRDTFCRELKARGFRPKKGHPMVFPWTTAWLAAYIGSGKMTVHEMARTYGIQEAAIYQQCGARGIRIPRSNNLAPPPRRLTIGKDELHRLYVTEGLTSLDIARRYNVCDSTVFRRLEDFGIPRRTREQGSHAKYYAKRRVKSLTSPTDLVQRTA